jgi:hypothetical protein
MEIKLNEDSHVYMVDGQITKPSTTELLKWAGLIDDTWFTEYGRIRGQLTHKVIKFHNDGILDESTVDPALEPYFHAYLCFLADSRFQVVKSEFAVFSPSLGIPGTVDIGGYFPRSPIFHIGDNKCNKVYDWTRLQLALYSMSRGGYNRRFGLELHANGTYKYVPFDNIARDDAEARGIVKRYREAA